MTVYFSPDPVGFFDERLHEVIPPGAIPISDDLHRSLLAGQAVGQRIVIGGDGMPALAPAPTPDLAIVKASLKAAVDQAAETRRLTVITGGAGQALTYGRKVDQARAAVAASNPEAADYPLLAASIGIDGADISAVAATVLAKDAVWDAFNAAIEVVRLSAKRSIDQAEDAEAARAVSPAWPATPGP